MGMENGPQVDDDRRFDVCERRAEDHCDRKTLDHLPCLACHAVEPPPSKVATTRLSRVDANGVYKAARASISFGMISDDGTIATFSPLR